MRTGLEGIRERRRADKRHMRIRILIAVVVLLALAVLYMCLMGPGFPMLSPGTVIENLYTFVRIQISHLFNGDFYNNRSEIISSLSYYSWTVNRFENLLLMLVSGAILSLSGTVYQTAMRNPMAVPTMLGVSSGVSLAQMIMVMIYAESVFQMATMRYVLSYAISIGSILLIVVLARVIGRKHSNVADLLLIGTIVNQVFRLVMDYIRSNMDDDTLYIYQEYAQNSQDYFQNFSDLGVLVLISFIVLLPLILMRFAFNVVSFDDEDTRALGVRATVMRTYGIIAGGVLTATAMIHAGNIGMLATVVPLMCRYIYGADFRTLMASSAIWGAIVLCVSNLVRSFTYLGDYQIPLGDIVSLLAIPLLVYVMWTQREGWSQTEN